MKTLAVACRCRVRKGGDAELSAWLEPPRRGGFALRLCRVGEGVVLYLVDPRQTGLLTHRRPFGSLVGRVVPR